MMEKKERESRGEREDDFGEDKGPHRDKGGRAIRLRSIRAPEQQQLTSRTYNDRSSTLQLHHEPRPLPHFRRPPLPLPEPAHDPFPTLLINLHMLALANTLRHPSFTIELLQPDVVFLVQGEVVEGHRVGVTPRVGRRGGNGAVRRRRRRKGKVRRVSGDNGRVAAMWPRVSQRRAGDHRETGERT